MIDWEVSSVDFWVSFNDKKPFPLTLFRRQAEWVHETHAPEAFTNEEQTAINGFVKERISDLKYVWKQNMVSRLRWDAVMRKNKKTNGNVHST